jgi:hypothetical protein
MCIVSNSISLYSVIVAAVVAAAADAVCLLSMHLDTINYLSN